MKQLFLLCACLLFSSADAYSQGKAVLTVKQPNHDFGLIKEDGGDVEHIFVVQNTGNAPLVIDRVTTSCGCASPEWSKDPVSPGGTKEIKIWYDPYGRPGTFYKTISIYSNSDPRRFVATIKGEVERKKVTPQISYPYSIGELKLLSKTVSFSTVRLHETLGEKIPVKNAGESAITVHIDNVPEFITVEARPQVLQPNETGEIIFLLNTAGIGKKGRYHTFLPVHVQPSTEGKATVQSISFGANIIDDFSKYTAAEKENAPSAQLSSTLVDFGKTENKGSILGIGGKVSQTLEITNKGKRPLVIYSISSEDKLIDISGGKKEIKPGSSAAFKINIRPKDIKVRLESTVTIVTNDPNGPVRLIKVSAEK